MSIYDSNKGLIISTYEETKEKIKEKFIQHFGDDFEVDEGTPNDFFINLLSDLLYQQLYLIQHAIQAQNIALAQNRELDYIGKKLNMPRLQEEQDDFYRTRILKKKVHQSATQNSLTFSLSQEECIQDLRIYHSMNSKSNFQIAPGYLYIILHMKKTFSQLSEIEQQNQFNQIAAKVLNLRAAGISTKNNPDSQESGVINPSFIFPEELRKYGLTQDLVGISIQEYFTLTRTLYIDIHFSLYQSLTSNLSPIFTEEEKQQLIQNLQAEFTQRFEGIGNDIPYQSLKHILGYYLHFSGWINVNLLIKETLNQEPVILKNKTYIAFPYDFIQIKSVHIDINKENVN